MAERSNAAVLKTVEGYTSGGSNPSLSANHTQIPPPAGFFVSIASESAPSGLAKYAMETKTSALADVSVIVASPLRDHEERIIPKPPNSPIIGRPVTPFHTAAQRASEAFVSI